MSAKVMPHAAVPNSILTVPLSSKHRVTLHFLIPPLLHFLIFAFEVAITIALCWNLFKVGLSIFTGVTVFLAFLPAIATTGAILVKGSKDVPLYKRLAFAFIAIIAFPIWATYRLSYRIFWAIEAKLIHNRKERILAKEGTEPGEINKIENNIEEALAYSMEPSSAELYLFLRAFLFSLPNCLLHSCIILAGWYDLVQGYETYIVQTASILLSLTYLSMTAAYYQYFESQRLLGRNFPWREKRKRNTMIKESYNEGRKNGEDRSETADQLMPSLTNNEVTNIPKHDHNPENKIDIEEEQREIVNNDEKKDRREENQRTSQKEHEIDSNKEIQATNDNSDPKAMTGPADESHAKDNEQKTEDEMDDNEIKEVREHHLDPPSPSSTDSSPRVTLRRQLDLVDLGAMGTYKGYYLPIPSEPAPPPPKVKPPRIPGGFRDIFCDSDSSVTSPRASREHSFRSTLFGWSANFRPNRLSVTSRTNSTLPRMSVPQGVFPALPLPTSVKEKPKRVALERDDAIGLCVSFCYWFFILTARILTLATAINFFLKPTLSLCAAHIILVTLWLLFREGRPYLQLRKLLLRFGLSLVALNGILLELGARPFTKKVTFLYALLIFLENLGLGLGWMLLADNDWWWSRYIFYLSMGSYSLSVSCSILYMIALRPRKRLLPPEDDLTVIEVENN